MTNISADFELGFSELIELNINLIEENRKAIRELRYKDLRLMNPIPLSAVFIGRDNDSGLKKLFWPQRPMMPSAMIK